ncbi:MAG: hypothetical protein ABR536_01260 [Solirubrobacterales bacterium]
MPEEGAAIHYAAVERGTPVYSSDGVELGKVDAILDNYEEHIFDGVVFETPDGKLLFADAPEVARTAELAVTLVFDARAAADLPAPDKAPPRYRANLKAGRVGRLFGRGWKRN